MSSRCWAIMMCTLMVLVGVVAAPAHAGVTTLVSVAGDGSQGYNSSGIPSVSADGRYVVFQSASPNLVPGDTNGDYDVFVHDRLTGGTTRVSVASDGTQGNDISVGGFISADGRYVGFASNANNLVAGDTNGWADIFVHDRQTGETTRVSVASDGTEGNSTTGDSGSISADGRYVTFESKSTNLVPGDTNGYDDTFVHDRLTGQTTRVSVASDGTQANHESGWGHVSGDGRYVAYYSQASNLVPGDTNGVSDIFVHDRQTGQTTRVSVASDGTEANHRSYYPSISADGRHVTFMSQASNLVPGDTNSPYYDTFAHDRLTGQTTRVSVASDGTQANGDCSGGHISADGRYVAFRSFATSLVPGDTNDAGDAFVHDRQTGQTTRVSVASDGTQGNGDSGGSYGRGGTSISGDGRYVAFQSSASNLVPGDTNERGDVFVRDRWASQCLTVTGNCWHMVTLPCHPTNPDPWEVFDELRPPSTALDYLSGCLYRYDPATMGYVMYQHAAPEDFGSMVAGAGYWLWLYEDATICYQAECSGGSESVHLATAGWHLMGSPQLVDTHLDATLWYHAGAGPYIFGAVTAPGDPLWLQDPCYCWSPGGGGYRMCGLGAGAEDDHLRIFRAYWVNTYVDDVTVEVPVP